MNLTTDVKTHVIITFTKSHHMINQKQFNVISQMGAGQQILIDGNLIKTNNIAEILDIQKYWEIYPQNKSYGQPYSDLPRISIDKLTKSATKANLEAFKKGLAKYDNDFTRTQIRKINIKLKEYESTPENS
jgi:hypothetical protein